jgi:hypothetical protein
MEKSKDITISQIRELKGPTDKFLATTSDNWWGITFGSFRMRDIDSGVVLFEIQAEERESSENDSKPIQYNFGPGFLELQTIGAQVEFSVGEQPVKDF